MVYDPIRDCDVPSPAMSNHPLDPWRGTPGSVGASGGYSRGQDGYFDGRHGTHSPTGDPYASGSVHGSGNGHGNGHGSHGGAQPPQFSGGQSSPTKGSRPGLKPRTSLTSSAMSLHEMMSDQEPARRELSSTPGQYEYDRRPSQQSSSSRLDHLLNNHHDDSYSRSSMSSAAGQSPRNSAAGLALARGPTISPASTPYDQPASHLAPSSGRPRHSASRSPNPPQPYPINTYVSPTANPSTLPSDYPLMGDPMKTPVSAALEHQNSGSSSSRRQGSVARPMLPPDTIPRQHSGEDIAPGSAARLTPHTANLPLRSPSISVSPRSTHQTLPTNTSSYSLSRPTSSGQPYHYESPSVSSRRLSEADPLRPTSSGSAGRPGSQSGSAHRLSVPRRDSQNSVASSSYREPDRRSPTPHKKPYDPERVSEGPPTLYDPIHPSEVEQYKATARRNNPLYEWSLKKRKQRAPSWSGGTSAAQAKQPTPSPATQLVSRPPADRRESVSGPSAVDGWFKVGGFDAHSNGHTHVSGGDGDGAGQSEMPKTQTGRKRQHEEPDGAVQRRRMDEQQHFVGNAAVASHYNQRREVGIEARELSPIIGLKKFNNWIKSVLIGKFSKDAQRQGGAKVLDLGCGKGGDLNKWKQARIKLYVALDIADVSVNQARKRYGEMNRPPFDAYFFAHDCFSQPLSDVLPPALQPPPTQYDLVSLQFCMHYAFESANKARMMMENVSRYMKTGGIFIGTIPDARLLLEGLQQIPEDAERLKFGNSCYFVEFKQREHQGMYGHEYRFFLMDAVEDVPEYLVHWDNFEALAYEYGLRCIYREPFSQILEHEQHSKDFGGLLKKMQVLNENGESAMNDHQWEAANLYMGFAFQKIR